MFQAIRKRITPSTVIATLALVLAMSGGAYAARKYLITSTKQISPKVLKQLTGKAGPAGKNGTNGTNGAPGATGPAGPSGPAGAGTQGEKGKEGEKGVEGKQGPPGPTEFKVLPKGQSETGSWSILADKEDAHYFTAISFPIPLAENDKPCESPRTGVEPYEAALCGAEVHYVNETGNEEPVFNAETFEYEPTGKATSACPGTAAEPAAIPGNLCIYQGHGILGAEEVHSGLAQAIIAPANSELNFAGFDPGAGLSGAILKMGPHEEHPVAAWGTWAVTAAE
jgi:hypothetical protein